MRRHPRTRRLSLFLSAHIGRILGWPTREALWLVQDLVELATQPKFVHQHVLQVHARIMSDNHAPMHRGRTFDSHRYPRDLHRVTLQGRASTREDVV